MMSGHGALSRARPALLLARGLANLPRHPSPTLQRIIERAVVCQTAALHTHTSASAWHTRSAIENPPSHFYFLLFFFLSNSLHNVIVKGYHDSLCISLPVGSGRHPRALETPKLVASRTLAMRK